MAAKDAIRIALALATLVVRNGSGPGLRAYVAEALASDAPGMSPGVSGARAGQGGLPTFGRRRVRRTQGSGTRGGTSPRSSKQGTGSGNPRN